jgi:hypothetical protein
MPKRIANHQAASFISRLEPFQGSNLRAEMWSGFTDRDGTTYPSEYRIYSYAAHLATVKGGKVTYLNNRMFSQTTSRHQTRIRQGLAGIPIDPNAEILNRK